MSAPAFSSNGGMAVDVPSSMTSNDNDNDKLNAAPKDVGWLFVPQYYTFLHDDPSKLHRFYSKRSTLVHGAEGGDEQVHVGQTQINQKIQSLGFNNAKVYVRNLDSHGSLNGGIIIQVLGDMSNDGGDWRKFAQTFFLAVQPDGYYVLNDIFRWLKDDDDDEDDEDAVDVNGTADDGVEKVADQTTQDVTTSVGAGDASSAGVATAVEAQNAVVDGAAFGTAPANAVEEAQLNGDLKVQEPTPAAPSEIGIDKKVTAVERDEAPVQPKVEAAAAQAAVLPADPSAAAPLPNGNVVPSSTSTQAEAMPAPAPAPTGPKTWANLAASNATKWGATVSAEARGISTARETQQQQQQQQQAGVRGSQHSTAAATSTANAAASSVRTGHVFIKNVIVDNMPVEGLQTALEAKFGPMKECQIIPSKACAFGEFASADAARKAIQISLPINHGGEGGVKIGKNGWSVTVEEKRKPGDRPSAGNANVSRGGRGGGAHGQGSSRGARGGRGGRGAAP